MTYKEIWKKQPAVRTAVSFLGRNIAQLGLHAFRRVGDTERERLTDHALPLLIGKPNPWTTGTGCSTRWCTTWASTTARSGKR